MTPTSLPNPLVMVIVLGALTLAPFVLVMVTSFVKISVVLSILRNALGTQNVPPSQVITGLAFVLSFFIMTPVAKQMYVAAGSVSDTRDMFSESSVKSLFEAVGRGREPLRRFLIKHSHDEDRILFIELANRLDEGASDSHAKSAAENAAQTPTVAPTAVEATAPKSSTSPGQTNIPTTPKVIGQPPASTSVSNPANAPTVTQPNVTQPVTSKPSSSVSKDDFQVIVPAFVTSQLKEAFEVGFLIFIPFVIIDMVIANILLAMGMSMLSPSVISLPFKLLLFVLVDGWFLIIRGLVLSYV
jgi:type III secretion protein R